MKKNKIIYIHQRPFPYIPGTFFEDKDDYYYYYGQGVLYHRYCPLEKQNSFEIEIWRGEVGVKKIKERIVKGVLCRVFPANHYYRFGTTSISMLKEIKKELTNNILIHYTATPHNYEFYLISLLFRNKIPILVTHQGGANPYWKFSKKKQLSSYISCKIEKYISKYVDMYFSGVVNEIMYFEKITTKDKIYTKPHWGVDINNFRPFDKTAARKELDLPINKKIIMLAGRLNQYRGVREAIQVRNKLREYFDVELLSVGATSKDYDYEYAKENGVKLIPHVPFEILPKYYASADCYLYLTYGDLNEEFAGTGIAPLEAMACNTPVVANTLYHFPELKLYELGKYVRNVEEAVEAIKEIFENPSKFNNTRKTIEENFDWYKVTQNIFSIYSKKFKEYYKIEV